jgi:hypothetical protein
MIYSRSARIGRKGLAERGFLEGEGWLEERDKKGSGNHMLVDLCDCPGLPLRPPCVITCLAKSPCCIDAQVPLVVRLPAL